MLLNPLQKIVLYGAIPVALVIVLLFVLFWPNEKPLEEHADLTTVEQTMGVSQESSEPSTNASAIEEPREQEILFQFEIADTKQKRERGLGGRTELSQNYGMLFIFPTKGNYGFWMKDMQVSIDIVWLSDKGMILGIEKDISPNTYPNVFYPPEDVLYVLETRANETTRLGWSVGASINLPLI